MYSPPDRGIEPPRIPQTSGNPIPASTSDRIGGDDQVATQIHAQTQADHDPDAGGQPLVHEADAEGVPHAESAHEAAGLSRERYLTFSLHGHSHIRWYARRLHHVPARQPPELRAPGVSAIGAPSSASSAGTCQSHSSLSFHGTMMVRTRATPGIVPITSFDHAHQFLGVAGVDLAFEVPVADGTRPRS